MKKNLLLFVIFLVLSCSVKANPEGRNLAIYQAATAITDGFITTWETSAADESIRIPINSDYSSIYNYTVDWGDGTTSSNLMEDATHTYSAFGAHTVKITGEFPAIKFGSETSDDANDSKIKTVEQWGNGTWKGMVSAFEGCKNLTTVVNAFGPKFETNASLSGMFRNCSSLDCDMNTWNMVNVVDISRMFQGASAFNGDIGDWDVKSITNMALLFCGASAFNGDISLWNVSNVTHMDEMFWDATAFAGDISNWDVGNVQIMYGMFYDALSFNGHIGNWDVKNVTNMSTMFSNAVVFNQGLNNWNVKNVTNTQNMFEGATAFNGNISDWDVSQVTNMRAMFRNCESFNQNIGAWDLSSVISTSEMFYGCTAFNQDVGAWDVSSVIEMTDMFGYAPAFNQDIGAWDVRAVQITEDMFYGASSFNQDIGAWQTNSLVNMDYMFSKASQFNQNIENWNVSNVITMESVFEEATAFDQNIGKWDIGQVANMQNMLNECGMSAANYEASLSGWAAKTVQNGVVLGAKGLLYCANAGHQTLIGNNNWTILEDRMTCFVSARPDGNGVVYVDSSVAVAGDGSSWTNALKYVSNATESANADPSITEIHIASGTYYPAGDKDLPYTDSSFWLTRPGLKILGGYKNGGGQRDVNLYPTVLSGDIGKQGDTTDNINNILVIMNIAEGADLLVVDGLTITGGKSIIPDYFNGYDYAGGITVYNAYANTVISNCKFIGNYGMVCSAFAIVGPAEAVLDHSLIGDPQVIN